jgi:hypothetical protein
MDRPNDSGDRVDHGLVPAGVLQHHGVKGMKWGVRKADETNGDFVVGKQNPLYNISADKPRDAKGQVYAAFTKKDVLNYRAAYTWQLKAFKGASKVFSNSFDLKGDLKVAGEKSQLDAFKKLWETDKDGVAKALAASQVDISISAAIVNRLFHIDRTKAYEKKFQTATEKYMLDKGFTQFQASLGAPGNNIKKPYYALLAKRGYSALLDLNDLKAMDSEKPVLIFKGKDVLRNKNSLELTESDYKLAMDTYYSKDTLASYNVHDLHAKHGDAVADFLKHLLTESEEVKRVDSVEDILTHFGVKGMKWGKHKNEASGDSAQATSTKTTAKKSGLHTVSNADLQTAIRRMQLEQDFKRLSVNEKSPIARWLSSTLLEIGKREVQPRIVKKVTATVIKKAATGGLA